MSAIAVNNSTSQPGSTLPRWANTVLVILIGYALAIVALKIYSTTNETVVIQNTSTSISAPTPAVDLLAISQRVASHHLFGNAAAPVEDKPEIKAPVIDTKLNLSLAGVFAYEPQERAIAIIGSANEESAYRVGDKIVGDVTLKAVYPDRVILDNRGKDEVLRLPDKSTPIASRRPVTQQASNATRQNQQASAGPVELPSTPGALRDTLAKNPSMLGRIVAAEPYQENGKLVGYRLTPKQNPEILEAQGIVAGDVITRVNNIELNSQKQGIRALRNAVKAQSLEVTILRDGVEIPLSISLAE